MSKNQTTFNPSLFNQTNFINAQINSILNNVNTFFPAKIVSIEDQRATIEPIINTIGINQESPPSYQIKDVPISSIRGGNYGIIVPYKEGDTVLCGTVQRDISLIKKLWQKANPNTARKFNAADSVVLFNLSNDLPTIYIKISDAGIEIQAPDLPVSVNASTVDVTATTANIDATCNLGGSGGSPVLTMNSIITSPNGACTISNPATKVNAK